MTSYQAFLQLLADNYKFELEAQKRICKMNNVTIDNICNNSNYDFKTSDGHSYEVKADHLALRTGNFYIEFMGYGKLSGISITQANYYIITDTLYYFKISIDELKKICQNCDVKKTKDGLTFGYLLNRFKLIKHSICI